MKAPKNFYNAVDQMKLGTDQIEDIKNKVDSIISLPSVTAEDNGKLLQVVNGEWVTVDLDANNVEY